MIVSGEASGDLHAAKLVRELRKAFPGELETFGSAGPKMRDEGVEPVVVADELSIVGLLEIGRSLPMFVNAYRALKRAAKVQRPDVAILVDFPDFNLKLARSLKKQGINVVYYISPQLWAWRSYRVHTIKKYVDLMISILPFEKEWYARRGVTNVEYVGSPLAREVHPSRSKDVFCRDHQIDPTRPVISLLPGSRHKEIVRILPELAKAASKLAELRPDAQFVIAVASDRSIPDVKRILQKVEREVDLPVDLWVTVGETFDALNASDAAAVTSGTATLEAAIIGTPMAIVYKTSAINYKLLRPLISVEHFGLVNLIAGERIAAEQIQDEFTPDALAIELDRLLRPEINSEMRAKLNSAAEQLGRGGASKRAAEAIIRLMGHPQYSPNK